MQSVLVLLSNEVHNADQPLGAQNTDKISELISRVKMVPNLSITDKFIAEIAEASGFSDQNYFARTFKKVTGMTPSQYRDAGRTR